MSYQRPQDPYIHSNASQYDERYQQSHQQGAYQQDYPQGYSSGPAAAGYHDYPDHASGYQGSAYKESQEGLYGGRNAAGYGQQRNAATQAAATYSYAKPKHGVSKWIKIGVPILILVIAGAVLGGVFGSRAAKDDNSSSGGSSGGSGGLGSGSSPNVQGAALTAAQQAAKNGGNNMLFYQGTDPYSNPSFVASNVDTSAPAYNGQAHNSSCSDSWTATNSLTSLRPHPRIMTTEAEWDCLPTKIANDAYLTVWNSTIFTNATNWSSKPPVAYVADGGFTGSGILDVSREVQQRVKAFAYAYKISNNTAFKNRLYLELNNAAGNTPSSFGQNGTRWNAAHFLDVAEMTSAFAMAYDWLYNDWNNTERTMIRDAIVNYGLVPGQNQYATADGWWKLPANGNGNWNCVCNGGMLTGALAIRGDGDSNQTAIADSIINSALENMRDNCMRGAYDDGTWSETANYWYFGTNAQGRALSSLITATGSDQGMMAANPNWYKTSDFHMYVNGPGGLFAYGDNGPNKFATTANQLMLYSRLTGDARPALYQRDRADAAFDPLSMFWYEPTAKGAFWNGLPLDRFFDDQRGQWASMRSSWTDPSAVFVGIKASNLTGHQTHGDLDAGDFVIDALGTRWAGEYGNGNYLSTDYFSNETQQSARWTYYRKATDGQNTLVINDQNQQVATCLPNNTFASTGVSQTGDLSFKPAATDAVQFISDLSSCYGQNAGTIQRGIRMLNGRRQVLVQDEIAQSSSITSVQWRVQTNGTVSISSDGKTATLTQSSITDPNAGVVGKVSLGGTKTMKLQILSPSNAVFTSQGPPAQRIYGTAVYSAPPEDSDQANVGVTALSIDLGGAQSGAQTLQVVWQPQWESLSAADQATPKSVPLSQWSLTSHN
ncbi:hypothetical protein NDA11_007925 [Ustilago hordei]|uniref:Heparinase II/III-like C-terminal domain-containing protein n=1 Tax=Ustilago hordei TaxID=120017 RepID=I2FWA5_USTHO|nr:uncharacterized protein UHO2_00625 [Ustilago hordei]KAJ1042194.1 hypothetical protein NDA10_004561 [Ustilago hordei]KAJ1587377.1 hypothetical protein NDA15_005005 [Ustilago hordei]KAJ1590460.1 hypothetical protein NDA12_007491 [Ustilago hordei]KAJ1594339.1 hypothetical protein NDA11_007925 [Ustilago hordei]KAJ1602119.1 hypothetical protein NDA14_001849 [Ustilago hordei]